MIVAETRNKLVIIALAIIALLGLLFAIWFFILNRGSIVITAKAPYQIEITNLKNVSCVEDTCSIDLIPGNYNFVIKKNGYRDETRDIAVPVNGKYEETINLRFIPVVVDVEKQDIFQKKIADNVLRQQLHLADADQVFSDESGAWILFLKRQKENFRQTLYLKNINQTEEPKLITSFIRDLKNPLIVLSPDRGKILIVDQSSNIANIYLVDLKTNTRTNIAEFALVRELKWMPDNQNFLLYARKKNSLEDTIFLCDSDNKSQNTTMPLQLELKTSLANIAVLDKNTLFAATNQDMGEKNNPEKLEGSLVTLGSVPLNVPEDSNQIKGFFSFVQYSLEKQQTRLLKVVPGQLPSAVKLSEDHAKIYFQQGQKTSYVKLSE